MPIYKILKLKNQNSIIGFPYVGYSESDGSYIEYADKIVTIDPDFASQHESDIDNYLDDYEATEIKFQFDFNELLIALDKKSERPLSLQYRSDEAQIIITYHWWKGNPAYEEEIQNITPHAQQLFDKLIDLSHSLE